MASISNYTFQAGKYTAKDLLVKEFQGKESISELYRFTVYVATKKIQIDFPSVIGKPAKLSILRASGKERFIHGIVDEVEYISETKAHIHYRFEVVPAVWLLKYRQNSRIFQGKKVEDIIKQVLTDASVTSENYEFSLQGKYDLINYCVQYRESDFMFISRLMEQEGIFYFFRHDDKKSVMIFADKSTIHKEIDSPSKIVYKAKTGKLPDKEHVFDYKYQEKIRPGLACLRDYNFVKPTLNLECSSNYEKDTNLEIYEYPGSYTKDNTGKSLAKVRMEALQVDRQVSRGAGTCRSFNPGFKFTLDEHSNPKFNCENLLISVLHRGSQKQVLGEEATEGKEEIQYKNEFQAILVPDKKSDMTLFRPHRKTPKPRINGNQTAVVVGPSGEEIYTDEHGRIKVQFHWDRKGQKDDKSSCWLRVAQLWAGGSWGGLFIPRIGQEVVVSFLEGDPDRPLVVGCVYNGDNVPPYALPDDMTKSTVKSDSSLGGGGFNEIRFEDKKGSEEIFVHGQKDWNITIGNDKNQTISNNETKTVGSDRTKEIGNDETSTIGNDRTKTVGNNQSETIGSSKTINVGANHTEKIGANMSLTVGANKTETVTINSAETVGAAKELSIGAAYQVTVGAAMNETVGGAKAEEVGGVKAEVVGANKTVQVGGKHTADVAKEYALKAKKIHFEAEDELSIKVGSANLVMKKSGDIQIKGKKINIKGSGDVVIKGSKILEN